MFGLSFFPKVAADFILFGCVFSKKRLLLPELEFLEKKTESFEF